MTKELPLYTCHKKVRALEIRRVGPSTPDASGKLCCEVTFADPAFAPIWVGAEMFNRYLPAPGDYYVVYEDGYASVSPRKAFLEGYTLTHGDSMLMERLNDLVEATFNSPPSAWLRGDPAKVRGDIARVAREAYVTINSLKHRLAFLQEKLPVDHPEKDSR